MFISQKRIQTTQRIVQFGSSSLRLLFIAGAKKTASNFSLILSFSFSSPDFFIISISSLNFSRKFWQQIFSRAQRAKTACSKFIDEMLCKQWLSSLFGCRISYMYILWATTEISNPSDRTKLEFFFCFVYVRTFELNFESNCVWLRISSLKWSHMRHQQQQQQLVDYSELDERVRVRAKNKQKQKI